jgi:CTP:molybdopterin cytidylyltransferase MocA
VGECGTTWNPLAPMIAAITAGGRVEGELAAALGTSVKALARISGATLLDAAIGAARGAGAQRIAVIGGAEVRAHCVDSVDAVVNESSDGRENLRRAFAEAGDQPLLLMASDMPFIGATAVGAFLAGVGGADLAMPIASVESYRAAYPGAPAHDTNLAGERIVNGSIFYFGSGVATRVLAIAQQLFAARKSLFGMASLLGPRLLVRFALGRLHVEDVELRAQQRLGLVARAVRDCSPELCFDVDTVADYRYALDRTARA